MGLFDPKAIVKNELKKLDFDHDGKPDVIEALDQIERGAKSLGSFLGRFDAHDIELILKSLNQLVGEKLSAAEVAEFAAGIAHLPAGLLGLQVAVEAAKKELK